MFPGFLKMSHYFWNWSSSPRKLCWTGSLTWKSHAIDNHLLTSSLSNNERFLNMVQFSYSFNNLKEYENNVMRYTIWYHLYNLIRSSSAAVLAASSDRLRPHGSVKLAQTHVALNSPTRQQVLQLMMTWLELRLAQAHVALTGPMRQQVL